jgi:hypothetical protein
MMFSSYPDMGSTMVRRGTAPQPLLTRDKLREIARGLFPRQKRLALPSWFGIDHVAYHARKSWSRLCLSPVRHMIRSCT